MQKLPNRASDLLDLALKSARQLNPEYYTPNDCVFLQQTHHHSGAFKDCQVGFAGAVMAAHLKIVGRIDNIGKQTQRWPKREREAAMALELGQHNWAAVKALEAIRQFDLATALDELDPTPNKAGADNRRAQLDPIQDYLERISDTRTSHFRTWPEFTAFLKEMDTWLRVLQHHGL